MANAGAEIGAREPEQFRALEQKENIFLTAYAGRGIVTYSGDGAGRDNAPALSQLLQTTPSFAVTLALPLGIARGPSVTFEWLRIATQVRRSHPLLPLQMNAPVERRSADPLKAGTDEQPMKRKEF